MASPNFEPGRPTENANELARLIERGLRETKAVDLEALCVLAGRKVQPLTGAAACNGSHMACNLSRAGSRAFAGVPACTAVPCLSHGELPTFSRSCSQQSVVQQRQARHCRCSDNMAS